MMHVLNLMQFFLKVIFAHSVCYWLKKEKIWLREELQLKKIVFGEINVHCRALKALWWHHGKMVVFWCIMVLNDNHIHVP